MTNETMAVAGLFIGMIYTPITVGSLISETKKAGDIPTFLFGFGWSVFISAMWIFK